MKKISIAVLSFIIVLSIINKNSVTLNIKYLGIEYVNSAFFADDIYNYDSLNPVKYEDIGGFLNVGNESVGLFKRTLNDPFLFKARAVILSDTLESVAEFVDLGQSVILSGIPDSTKSKIAPFTVISFRAAIPIPRRYLEQINNGNEIKPILESTSFMIFEDLKTGETFNLKMGQSHEVDRNWLKLPFQ